MKPIALGSFEHQVLLAVLRLGGKTQTACVAIELEERTGKRVSSAAVYIALRRLTERGLMKSWKREPEPGEGGRGRRTFEVTPLALDQVRATRRTLERLWDGLDPVFDEK